MAADIILTGGRVLTLDARGTVAESIAITGDRVTAVGSDTSIRELAGPKTETVSLGGRAVIPGINDTHAHLDREGLKEIRLSLAGARSVRAIQDKIAAAAHTTPKGEWIVAMPIGDPPFFFGGPQLLAEKRMPSRAELDAAAPDHPVCIMGLFGYWGKPPAFWALNSAGLARAGVGRDSTSAIGTLEIERDASGAPTGVIVERSPRPLAQFEILRGVPRFTFEERKAALKRSMQLYNAVGTTSIYEGHGASPELIALYRTLHQEQALTIRAGLVVSPTWRDEIEARAMMRDQLAFARGAGLGDPWLRVGGVHIGYLGDPTARKLALSALPDTGWCGFIEPASTAEAFHLFATLAAEHDLRVNAIASAGKLDAILPIYAEIDRRFPLRDRRWVIQHLDFVRPPQVAEIKRLGLHATTIPASTLWKEADRFLDAPNAGQDVTPLKALADAGVPVSAGTDNVPVNPFFTLWAMLARQERTTGRVLGPGQRLTPEQGLRLLTSEGAKLTFEENLKGTLEAGRLADIAVLTADPTAVPTEEVKSIRAALTMVGGRIVHRAEI